MNFFYDKDLGNHLLQLCPKVVKHPVYIILSFKYNVFDAWKYSLRLNHVACVDGVKILLWLKAIRVSVLRVVASKAIKNNPFGNMIKEPDLFLFGIYRTHVGYSVR